MLFKRLNFRALRILELRTDGAPLIVDFSADRPIAATVKKYLSRRFDLRFQPCSDSVAWVHPIDQKEVRVFEHVLPDSESHPVGDRTPTLWFARDDNEFGLVVLGPGQVKMGSLRPVCQVGSVVNDSGVCQLRLLQNAEVVMRSSNSWGVRQVYNFLILLLCVNALGLGVRCLVSHIELPAVQGRATEDMFARMGEDPRRIGR